MRANEFTKPTVTESNHMDADQVLQYVKKTHAPEEFNIEYSITDHPAWELKNIPVSQLNLDPDGEQQDPYNRTNWVDYDVVRDLMPKIAQVLKSKPIVVDSDGWIIDGNHRAMAAAEAGLTSVPALVPADVNENFHNDTEESKTVEFEGLTLKVIKQGHELTVDALDDWGNKVLGHVKFNIGDGQELDPQDLRVDDKYQGQGIARVMYDYVKSLGYTINRSWDQTDAGAGFWNKHRGEDVRVWEQDVAEGKQPGQAVVDAILKVLPVAQEIWFHGSRATGKHRRNSDTDILVVVPDDLVGDQYLGVVRILQKLSSHFDNYDIQPTKAETNIHRIAQEEGKLLWSKQGMTENFADGKNPGRKGLSKRVGVNTKASVSSLRKTAKNSSGEKQRMAHWLANMKAGRAKAKRK